MSTPHDPPEGYPQQDAPTPGSGVPGPGAYPAGHSAAEPSAQEHGAAPVADPAAAVPSQGYPLSGYPPPGYGQHGYAPANYPPPGYPPPGYGPPPGYPPPGYGPPQYVYGQPVFATPAVAYLPSIAPRTAAVAGPQVIRVLAGPGRRLGARLIDGVLLYLLFAAVFGIAAAINWAVTGDTLNSADPVMAILGFGILGILLLWEPLWVSGKGGTPGKLWLGIRVTSVDTGRRPGFGAALGRYLSTFLFGIVPIVGLLNVLWLLWDQPLTQCLHDKLARTTVVYREGDPG